MLYTLFIAHTNGHTDRTDIHINCARTHATDTLTHLHTHRCHIHMCTHTHTNTHTHTHTHTHTQTHISCEYQTYVHNQELRCSLHNNRHYSKLLKCIFHYTQWWQLTFRRGESIYNDQLFNTTCDQRVYSAGVYMYMYYVVKSLI